MAYAIFFVCGVGELIFQAVFTERQPETHKKRRGLEIRKSQAPFQFRLDQLKKHQLEFVNHTYAHSTFFQFVV